MSRQIYSVIQKDQLIEKSDPGFFNNMILKKDKKNYSSTMNNPIIPASAWPTT